MQQPRIKSILCATILLFLHSFSFGLSPPPLFVVTPTSPSGQSLTLRLSPTTSSGNDSFHIREATIEDAPAIHQLLQESVESLGTRYYSQEQVHAWVGRLPNLEATRQRLREPTRTTWVAVASWSMDHHANDKIMGTVDLDANGHLDLLYVHPMFADRGLATQLVQHVLHVAKSKHGRSKDKEGHAIHSIFVEASEGARSVLEREGFRVIERQTVPMDGDVVLWNYRMEMRLS